MTARFEKLISILGHQKWLIVFAFCCWYAVAEDALYIMFAPGIFSLLKWIFDVVPLVSALLKGNEK